MNTSLSSVFRIVAGTSSAPQDIHETMLPGLRELWRVTSLAHRHAIDPWQCAVRINQLQDLGLSEPYLHWLVSMQYVEHGTEVTRCADTERQFEATGLRLFALQSCFVLTPAGIQFVRATLDGVAIDAEPAWDAVSPGSPSAADQFHPCWRRPQRVLTFQGQVIKCFARQAHNQECLLDAFEAARWIRRIADPLPSRDEQTQRDRLHDTIKCLNRGLMLIRFVGDGTGRGVIWERTV